MKDIRLGTIGTGIIVRNVLDQALQVENIFLEAVYSRSQERANALAARYGCQRTFTDPEAFFRDPAINCVYIALPNALHFAWAKRALISGKHVLLEKPFTPTLAQAEELFRLAEERGLVLAEAVPTAFLPNLRALKDALPRAGRVRLVVANFSKHSSRYDQLKNGELTNIFDPKLAGGCLMDINYYNAYLTCALFGPPKHVAYYPNTFEGAADTSGVLLLTYDGMTASCAAAKDVGSPITYLIEGEKGTIQVEDGANGLKSITVETDEGTQVIDLQPDKNRYIHEARGWARLLLGGEAPDRATTLQAVKVIEKAWRGAGLCLETGEL